MEYGFPGARVRDVTERLQGIPKGEGEQLEVVVHIDTSDIDRKRDENLQQEFREQAEKQDLKGCMAALIWAFSRISLLRLLQDSQADDSCGAGFNRYPANEDISVNCGIQVIDLSINICPLYFAGFDPLTLDLNGQDSDPQCAGRVDASLSPPRIHYSFVIDDASHSSCGSQFQILDEGPGTGTLTQFSNLQSVVISGFIDSPENGASVVSYRPDIFFKFSCKYPLEYILKNTKLKASSISVAVAMSNGSFSSSLTLQLYNDQNFTSALIIPDTGLPLRYKVYVEVSVNNLTANFNVLLDHCFATPSPFNASALDTGYSFFVGCNVTPHTNIITNGIGQKSQFVFDAFRFTEHSDRKVSTVYVHCITRLCEAQTCHTLLKGCFRDGRRKGQSREDSPRERVTTETFTVSSGPIYTSEEEYTVSGLPAPWNDTAQSGKDNHMSLVGPIIGIVLAVTAGGLMIATIRKWIRSQVTKRKQPEGNHKDTGYSAN
ncbi:zona pellucida-like domain-containing protein 1 [Mustelus asterias]